MSELLDEAWLASLNSALSGIEADGAGGSGVAELVVTMSGGGRSRTCWVVEDGRLAAVLDAAVGVEGAGVVLPISDEALGAILRGDLDASVAFMRGDLKPEGSSGALFALLSALARTDVRAVLARSAPPG